MQQLLHPLCKPTQSVKKRLTKQTNKQSLRSCWKLRVSFLKTRHHPEGLAQSGTLYVRSWQPVAGGWWEKINKKLSDHYSKVPVHPDTLSIPAYEIPVIKARAEYELFIVIAVFVLNVVLAHVSRVWHPRNRKCPSYVQNQASKSRNTYCSDWKDQFNLFFLLNTKKAWVSSGQSRTNTPQRWWFHWYSWNCVLLIASLVHQNLFSLSIDFHFTKLDWNWIFIVTATIRLQQNCHNKGGQIGKIGD